MKYVINDLSIEQEYGHAKIIEELSIIAPQWTYRDKSGNAYRWFLPCTTTIDMDSELAQKIIAVLHKHGLKRWSHSDKLDYRIYYSFKQERVYGKRDLAQCEYFLIDSKHLTGINSFSGHVHDCATSGTAQLYISDVVRSRMLESDLRGYKIKPPHYLAPDDITIKYPCYILGSQHFFPPAQPNPTPDIFPTEYYYLRSQIKHLEGMDVIYQEERYDEHDVHSEIIVSKRFYDWWSANKFKRMIFIPCRIIEDLPHE